MRIPFLLAATGFLFICACIFDNDEPTFTYEKYETTLDFEIESIEDNGYYIDKIHLEANEVSPNHFYVIESPEMLDSVFSLISYSGESTPLLDDFFPDNGVLVIFDGGTYYNDCYDHTISFSDSSLFIDVTFEVPDKPLDPCPPLDFVIPVGVVPKN